MWIKVECSNNNHIPFGVSHVCAHHLNGFSTSIVANICCSLALLSIVYRFHLLFHFFSCCFLLPFYYYFFSLLSSRCQARSYCDSQSRRFTFDDLSNALFVQFGTHKCAWKLNWLEKYRVCVWDISVVYIFILFDDRDEFFLFSFYCRIFWRLNVMLDWRNVYECELCPYLSML